jgi:hypothetical protein
MSVSLKKLWNDYGLGGILIAIVGLYVLSMLFNYFSSKGMIGGEMMSEMNNPAYKKAVNDAGSAGPSAPQPAAEMQLSQQQSGSANMSPSDLLPRDGNSEWAQLNPAGQGDLANINLLKAGYHIGIDTVGQTLRNANLQIRSEPPNPQVNVGPWNLSTIEPDFMRPPLELGQGGQ